MKFAVIEYSSKSKRVWKHQPNRPNYLCDPEKEIDPTSFGCYVSALEGEHIPLTWLILGSSQSPVAKARQFVFRAYKKLTGHWPQIYSLNYLEQFDVLMVVHQISNGHEITALTARLRRLYPKKFIIGVPTQPFGLLKNYWQKNPGWLADFKRYMDLCHVFVSINQAVTEEWQQLTKTPVLYVPQPYPVEYASQYFSPISEKKPIIFVAGTTERPNIAQGQRIAAQLQKKHPEHLIHVTDTPGFPLDIKNLKTSRYKVIPFAPWEEHLKYLRHVKLVINTDYTYTRGRVQVDCAAVGTPSVGGNSDGQIDLFSRLQSHPKTSDAEIFNWCSKLLTDASHYEETVSQATQQLQKYNYQQSAQRIKDLVEKYG